MKKKVWVKAGIIWLTLILVALPVFWAYAKPASAAPAPKPVKVGHVTYTTGEMAANGVQAVGVIKIAVEEINKAGGIKSMGGAPLEIKFYDSQSDPGKALSACEQAISEGAQVILTSLTSNQQLALMVANERAGIFAMNATALGEEIYERGFKYTFGASPSTRTAGTDPVNILDWLVKGKGLKVDRIVCVSSSTSYTDAMVDTFEETAKNRGYNIVGKVRFDSKALDVTSAVLKIKALNPDLVAVSTNFVQDTAIFHRNCYDQRFTPYLLGLGNMHTDAKTSDMLGPEIIGWMEKRLVGSEGQAPGVKIKANEDYMGRFAQRVREAFPGVDAGSRLGPASYLATIVLKEMLEIVGSTNGDKLREAALKLRFPRDRVPMATTADLTWDKTGRVHGLTTIGSQWRGSGKTKIAVWPEDICIGRLILEGVTK